MERSIVSTESQYVFYVETVNKFRRYLSVIDDMLQFNPTMHDASRFSLFQDGLKVVKSIPLKEGQKLGYVKILTTYEYKDIY
jgi:hypothetical protein